MKIIQDLMVILEPEEGYLLTDGNIYSDKVFLGCNSNPSEWHEVSEKEVPEDVRISIENHIPDEGLV